MALIVAAGVAADLTRYAHATEGRLLPGTVIAGHHVGGMRPEEARATVASTLATELDATVSLTHDGRTWTRSAADLGVTTDLDEQVDAAARAAQVDLLTRARTRYLRRTPGPTLEVTASDPTPGLRSWVRSLAYDLDLDPVDARLDYDDQRLQVLPHRVGLRVDQIEAIAAARGALRDAATAPVRLPVERLAPSTTTADLGQVLFLDQSDHRLDLYLDGRLAHSYTVTTGTGRYPTPTGEYEITVKRPNPTWINPAPTGWGRGLPRRIGPGPNNPLGLRALNWSVGAIRFHGTADVNNLGRDASHGCVRLANGDIVHLYELVDVGATIVSVR